MKALQATCIVGAITFTGMMIHQVGGNTPDATVPATMPEAAVSETPGAPALSTVNATALSVRVKIDFHRQPGCHDLGDGGRDEWLISVLGHQLVALGVHHEHQPLRSEGRDVLLDAGQSRG